MILISQRVSAYVLLISPVNLVVTFWLKSLQVFISTKLYDNRIYQWFPSSLIQYAVICETSQFVCLAQELQIISGHLPGWLVNVDIIHIADMCF